MYMWFSVAGELGEADRIEPPWGCQLGHPRSQEPLCVSVAHGENHGPDDGNRGRQFDQLCMYCCLEPG